MRLLPIIFLLTGSAASPPPDNPDGSAGNPPALYEYFGVASGASVGFDYHTVFGLATADGGSLTVGTGLKRDGADELFDGVAIKLGRCASYPTQFEMLDAGDADPAGCGVQWVYKVKSDNLRKSAQLLWAAEAPGGSYVIVVGLRWQDDLNGYGQYIAKLNATSGAQIWDVVVQQPGEGAAAAGRHRLLSKSYAGLESVTFTADGGFVASGFVGATTEPHFKSSGQVETGHPSVLKFSAAQAAAPEPPGAPLWRYVCAHEEDAFIGSAKVVREDVAHGGAVVALVGTGAALIYLGGADGAEGAVGDFGEHGQASDFALVPGGSLLGGLRASTSTAVCPDGCTYVTGRISFIAVANATAAQEEAPSWALPLRLERRWTKSYGNPPGGQYQFAGLARGPDELIYTECWGIQPTKNASSGLVDGVVMACGTGIEGCDTEGLTPALVAQCKADPRTTWRALTLAVDLSGELRWRRVDSFKSADSPTVGTSAAEYVFLQQDGAPVLVTDEGFGAGWIVLR